MVIASIKITYLIMIFTPICENERYFFKVIMLFEFLDLNLISQMIIPSLIKDKEFFG